MKRPHIPIRLTRSDVIAEAIGWSIIILHWIFTLWHFDSLPEIIPIHFNARGEADGFGSKSNLMTLPIVNTLLFVGMTLLNRFPQAFNYMEPITPENAQRQYRSATRMIRYMKLMVAFVFFIITYSTVETVFQGASGWTVWVLPLLFVSTLGVLIYGVQACRKS